MKKLGMILGILSMLVIVVSLSGCTDSSTDNTSTTTTDTQKTPTPVTISQLYGTSIAEGTYVKVTGTALESDGYRLRMQNSDGKDILVTGSSLNAYEDKSVTVQGTFVGPTSYATAMGSTRTVPTIENAKVV